MQKHQDDPHNPTVEEVPDEEDLKHTEPPVSSSVLEAPEDATAPDWNPTLSAKAAGKRKEEIPSKESKPLLDTQSEELFPVLGGAAKPQSATAASSLWGKKPVINGTNGFSTNGTSTPTSGINTPTSTASKVGLPKAIKAIPGQDHRQEYSLEKSQMLSRAQLKKPLPEILKDMNRKAKKTNVTFTTTQQGTKFVATGPSDEAAQRALIDVLAEVCSKVSPQKGPRSFSNPTSIDYSQDFRSSNCKSAYHWEAGVEDKGIAREDRRKNPGAKVRGSSPAGRRGRRCYDRYFPRRHCNSSRKGTTRD